MDDEKYNRSILLLCPTCGSTQLEQAEESSLVTCASCGRELTSEELIHENSENIQKHVEEIGQQAAQDFGQRLKKSLQDEFKNNKFIKIK